MGHQSTKNTMEKMGDFPLPMFSGSPPPRGLHMISMLAAGEAELWVTSFWQWLPGLSFGSKSSSSKEHERVFFGGGDFQGSLGLSVHS